MSSIRDRQLRRKLIFSKEDHDTVVQNFLKEEEDFKKIKEDEEKNKTEVEMKLREEDFLKKRENEEKNKKEIEIKLREERRENIKRRHEENMKKKYEEKMKKDQEEKMKKDQEEKMNKDQEEKMKKDQEEKIKKDQEEKMKKDQEEKMKNKQIIKKVYSYSTNENKIIYPTNIKNNNVVIVIAHYNEDLNWIHNLEYPYIVISKGGLQKEQIPNKGNEASSFLEYIINNYDNLSEYTLFVHGHRTSWHHKTNTDERVNKKLLFNKPYYNINELKMDKQLVNNEEYIKMLEKNCNINYDRKNKHTYRAGAQFYVHKDLILRNSKQVYQDFHNYLMNSKIGSFSTGRFFEYTWHIIFTHGLNDIE